MMSNNFFQTDAAPRHGLTLALTCISNKGIEGEHDERSDDYRSSH